MTETETKIAAAQEAVAKAAALLLEHAEGLGMLAMVESRREPPDLMDTVAFRNGETVIRNVAAEQAWSQAALAAARFAGRFEAFQQERDRYSEVGVILREQVERLVGDTGSFPPPLSRMPATAGNAELGITPDQVHAQAWRSHLAASASKAALTKAGGRP